MRICVFIALLTCSMILFWVSIPEIVFAEENIVSTQIFDETESEIIPFFDEQASVLDENLSTNKSELRTQGMDSIIISGQQDYENVKKILDLVNDERKKNNLPNLVLDNDLTEAMMLRAMENTVYSSHTRPDGRSCYTAFPEKKGSAGESIAAGNQKPEEVINGFLGSSTSRGNILRAEFQSLGVGYFSDGYSGSTFWVLGFSSEPPSSSNIVGVTGEKTRTILFDQSVCGLSFGYFPHDVTMEVGKTQQTVVAMRNQGWTSSQYFIHPENMEWQQNNPKIAKIDKGIIYAIAAGNTKITGKVGGQQLPITVTITGKTESTIPVSDIKLDSSNITLVKGNVTKLAATVNPSNATNKSLGWSSRNQEVAAVADDGTITAVGEGETIVSCKAQDGSNKEATCVVRVKSKADNKLVTEIKLDKINITLKEKETLKLNATIKPSDVTNQALSWVSSNPEIVTVKQDGRINAVALGVAVITCKALDGSGQQATCTVTVTPENQEHSIAYKTHVQDFGWQTYSKNGEISGTMGQSKRLEGIRIKLENQEYSGDVRYMTHIQNVGWEQTWKQNDSMSGTEGRALRLEAIRIELTGDMASHYDVFYRVHCQNLGWMGWAKNGEKAGSAGFAYRLEGIQIQLVKKGEAAPGPTEKAYQHPLVQYNTHIQDIGWQNSVSDGEMSGTTGLAKRLEGIHINLSNQDYSGSIQYRTHIQNIGWENTWREDGELSGTSGKSLRLEAIQIKLTGEMADHFDVYYRVHCQNLGWMGWAVNGENAGSAGYSYRLEGIQIQLVAKGGAAPGSTEDSFKDIEESLNMQLEASPDKISINQATPVLLKLSLNKPTNDSIYFQDLSGNTIGEFVKSSNDETKYTLTVNLLSTQVENKKYKAVCKNDISNIIDIQFYKADSSVMLSDFSVDNRYFIAGYKDSALFTIKATNVSNNIELYGKNNVSVGSMHDDGKNGDIAAGDQIYSIKAPIYASSEENVDYYVKAGEALSNTIQIHYFSKIDDKGIKNYESISNTINNEEKKYMDAEGYVPSDQIDSCISDIANYAKNLKDTNQLYDYKLNYYNGENVSVWMKTNSGMEIIFMPKEKGVANTDPGFPTSFITYQPSSGEKDGFPDNVFDENNLEPLKKWLPSCREEGYFKNDDVDSNSIGRMKPNQIILWTGHGLLGTDYNVYLKTGMDADAEAVKKYENNREAVEGIYCIDTTYKICVGYKYIQEHVGNIDNSFVYLNTCYSAMDHDLCQAFLNKGAKCVVANSDEIKIKYILPIQSYVIELMAQINSKTGDYYTISEALSAAQKRYGGNDEETYTSPDGKTVNYQGKGATTLIYNNNGLDYRFAQNNKRDFGSIRGKVIDSYSKKEIGDVIIEIYDENNKKVETVQTNDKGQFDFAELQTGTYVLKFIKNEYNLYEKKYQIQKDQALDVGEIMMDRQTVLDINAKKAYRSIVSDYVRKKYWNDSLKKEMFYECRYSIFDMNNDGVPELFVNFGKSEADKTFYIYSYVNGEIKYLGTFHSGHSGLYGESNATKGQLLVVYGQMDYWQVHRLDLINWSIQSVLLNKGSGYNNEYYIKMTRYRIEDKDGKDLSLLK